jgi:hypothetical protein
MTDEEILARIHKLVAEEHELRDSESKGTLSPQEEQAKVKRVETALDQCWDLLRQRRARKEAGEDPGLAQARPESEVEGYLQ